MRASRSSERRWPRRSSETLVELANDMVGGSLRRWLEAGGEGRPAGRWSGGERRGEEGRGARAAIRRAWRVLCAAVESRCTVERAQVVVVRRERRADLVLLLLARPTSRGDHRSLARRRRSTSTGSLVLLQHHRANDTPSNAHWALQSCATRPLSRFGAHHLRASSGSRALARPLLPDPARAPHPRHRRPHRARTSAHTPPRVRRARPRPLWPPLRRRRADARILRCTPGAARPSSAAAPVLLSSLSATRAPSPSPRLARPSTPGAESFPRLRLSRRLAIAQRSSPLASPLQPDHPHPHSTAMIQHVEPDPVCEDLVLAVLAKLPSRELVQARKVSCVPFLLPFPATSPS